MYFLVIYLDPDDNEEKGLIIKAPNERLAMRAVFGEIVQITAFDDDDDIEVMEEEWNLP